MHQIPSFSWNTEVKRTQLNRIDSFSRIHYSKLVNFHYQRIWYVVHRDEQVCQIFLDSDLNKILIKVAPTYTTIMSST